MEEDAGFIEPEREMIRGAPWIESARQTGNNGGTGNLLHGFNPIKPVHAPHASLLESSPQAPGASRFCNGSTCALQNPLPRSPFPITGQSQELYGDLPTQTQLTTPKRNSMELKGVWLHRPVQGQGAHWRRSYPLKKRGGWPISGAGQRLP